MEFYKIETEAEARDLIRIMPDVIAIDTEYVKGDPRTTKLLSVIVADSDRAWAISPSLLPMLSKTIRARKLIFLQDYNHCDTIILLKNGCDLRETNTHNIIDMHHLLDENAEHALGSRVLQSYGDNYKASFWSVYKSYEDAPEDEQLEYACKDAVYTYRLGFKDLEKIYTNEPDSLEDLYNHVRQLSDALLDTELHGVNVNVSLMTETKESMGIEIQNALGPLRENFQDWCSIREMNKFIKVIEKYKTEAAQLKHKPEFNFNSSNDISWLIYGGLGCPVLRKTPVKISKKTGKRGGGNPSTDYEAIEELSRNYPVLLPLLKYKEIQSVYETFVVGMLERVKDGRIYPYFNVSGTATGRISHSDPNMGNLPKEGVIRNFFIPSPDMVIIGADYEQLEVVVELNLTEDPGLKEIVCGGISKHDLFKAELDRDGFNLPRSQVKNVNFALQYDAQAKKIAKMVGCSEKDAERIIEIFYTKFSGVKKLKEETKMILSRDGQITNLARRTRRFPKPTNKYEMFKQQRQAYNFLIQGVAGEACNRAYYRFHNKIKSNLECTGRGLFPVHDEIVAEMDIHSAEYGMAVLKRVMEESTEDFNFKYALKSKPYGPLAFWQKT